MEKSLILNHEEISLKLDRIAWQILEQHYGVKTILLVGLADRGFDVAGKIKNRLDKYGEIHIELTPIYLDKTKALASEITLEKSELVTNKAVILVDDVLNSGRTMAAALKEILNHNPKTVKTAVLANRDHHTFPIQADFVGISLATTVKEHISYEEVDGKMSIILS
ncbi:phosphoribosyltransferase family protein [Bacteroidia bacterium]|nr:phosphoribosyltransferase family protein [Bacteroidia bacterium]